MNKDSIWWTRKAWINAERRLLLCAHWSNISLFWFSLCGVFASVLLLGEEKPEVISKVFICFSVFVFCVSLFTSLGRYKERANEFKQGYIELQQLYIDVKSKSAPSEDDINNYSKILHSCENHSSLDFINAKVEAYKNTTDKKDLTITAGTMDFIIYYSIKIMNVMMYMLIFTFPISVIYTCLG
ncbi:SLATT domain-containing protein [Vibrio diazotrophicus]|uniref:SLATT domain-containing protein n=1 Tax=Vibrio diazotrophicus TaxID=685 RepID=UPI00142E5F0F|nr:SLATT domain-containing protein [Vibrio diazotrophicus]NIY94257.1 SLATT domain-containing protein [Vibrio diazotrophicus]